MSPNVDPALRDTGQRCSCGLAAVFATWRQATGCIRRGCACVAGCRAQAVVCEDHRPFHHLQQLEVQSLRTLLPCVTAHLDSELTERWQEAAQLLPIPPSQTLKASTDQPSLWETTRHGTTPGRRAGP
jgi:hypothetical protein